MNQKVLWRVEIEGETWLIRRGEGGERRRRREGRESEAREGVTRSMERWPWEC